MLRHLFASLALVAPVFGAATIINEPKVQMVPASSSATHLLVTDATPGGPTATHVRYLTLLPQSMVANLTSDLAGKQAADSTLTGLAGVATSADKLIYATGPDAFSATTLTAFARTLLDDADAAAVFSTLGLGTAATYASTAFATAAHTHLSADVTDASAAGTANKLAKYNASGNLIATGFSTVDGGFAADSSIVLLDDGAGNTVGLTPGEVIIGSSTGASAGLDPGTLTLTNTGGFAALIKCEYLSANRVIQAPNEAGTLMLATSAYNGSGLVDHSVTLGKLPTMTAARLLGRRAASGGDAEELTMADALAFISTTRGAILYYGASGWTALAPGTSGEVLTSQGSGADPSWQTAGSGSQRLFVKGNASDITSSSTTLADATGLTCTVSANTTYVVEANVFFTTNTSSEGLGLALNGPSGATVAINIAVQATSSAWTLGAKTAWDDPVVGATGSTTPLMARITARVAVSSTAGTVALRLKSETGGANSATIKAGSSFTCSLAD